MMPEFNFEELVSMMAGLEMYRQNYMIEQYMDGIEDAGSVPEIDLDNDEDYQSILTAQTKVGTLMDMQRSRA